MAMPDLPTLMPSIRCLRDVPKSFGPAPPRKSLVLITRSERFKLSSCMHRCGKVLEQVSNNENKMPEQSG